MATPSARRATRSASFAMAGIISRRWGPPGAARVPGDAHGDCGRRAARGKGEGGPALGRPREQAGEAKAGGDGEAAAGVSLVAGEEGGGGGRGGPDAPAEPDPLERSAARAEEAPRLGPEEAGRRREAGHRQDGEPGREGGRRPRPAAERGQADHQERNLGGDERGLPDDGRD